MAPFIGTLALSSTLTTYLQTTNPNTASSFNADALPIYRVYASTGNAPLTSGTFSQLDLVNVVGLYATQFVLSTTHGFSASGTYCIRKDATVCGVSAAQLDTFRIFLSGT